MNVIQNNILLDNSAKTHHELKVKPQSASDSNFSQILSNKLENSEKVQFSKHAQLRLQTRDLKITSDQLQRIEMALAKANAKGIRESLVVVDDMALVVSVKNKLVITAMDKKKEENVFTNIDGAVIV